MSSGKIVVSLPGISVDGEFTNGRLITGRLTIANIEYTGTFNTESLLHGDNCCMKIGLTEYKGRYSNGELVVGATYINDVLTEEGDYTFISGIKRPHLVRGKKVDGNLTWNGHYDNNGYLTKGTCIDGTSTYSGKFVSKRLIEGTVEYQIGSIPFTATYELSMDMYINHEVFKSCVVKYAGSLEVLPRKLMIMACCSNVNSSTAHKFFIKYLNEFDSSTVRFIHRGMFRNISPTDEAGLMLILENLAVYNARATGQRKLKRGHDETTETAKTTEPTEPNEPADTAATNDIDESDINKYTGQTNASHKNKIDEPVERMERDHY